jgi:predicted GNAT superfamily acetyltransferase
MQAGDLAAVMRMNNGNVPAVSLIDFDELQQDVRLAEHALVVTDTATSEPHGVNYAWFADRYPAFVYLDRVVIDTPFQSQGRGELLYAEVERRIRATGHTDLFVCEVNLQPRNEGSLRFHARLGFEQVGEQESKPGLIVAMLAKRLV